MRKILFSPLTLVVLAIGLSINVQPGLVSYWPGNENANDIAGSNPATTPGGGVYAPGVNASLASRHAFG